MRAAKSGLCELSSSRSRARGLSLGGACWIQMCYRDKGSEQPLPLLALVPKAHWEVLPAL